MVIPSGSIAAEQDIHSALEKPSDFSLPVGVSGAAPSSRSFEYHSGFSPETHLFGTISSNQVSAVLSGRFPLNDPAELARMVTRGLESSELDVDDGVSDPMFNETVDFSNWLQDDSQPDDDLFAYMLGMHNRKNIDSASEYQVDPTHSDPGQTDHSA